MDRIGVVYKNGLYSIVRREPDQTAYTTVKWLCYEGKVVSVESGFSRMQSAFNHAQKYVMSHADTAFVGFVHPSTVTVFGDCECSNMVIYTKRFAKETYYYEAVLHWFVDKPYVKVVCRTPKNAFGYHDTLRLVNGHIRQDFRNDVPEYIRKRVKADIRKLSQLVQVWEQKCELDWSASQKRGNKN